MSDFDKYSDVIDSRDVIARIKELEAERDAFTPEGGIDEEPESDTTWKDANPDDAEELRILLALAEEAEDYADDWEHGETLIRDSYFQTYAQELAEDCGMLENATAWPLTCIDWEQAARELQYDYSSIEFDGVTYWIR